jgi:hypothetical protein
MTWALFGGAILGVTIFMIVACTVDTLTDYFGKKLIGGTHSFRRDLIGTIFLGGVVCVGLSLIDPTWLMIDKDSPFAWKDFPFVWFGLLQIGGAVLWSRYINRASASSGDTVEVPVQGYRNNYPLLTWTQETGTRESYAANLARVSWYIWLGFTGLGAAIGWSVGGAPGALAGGLGGLWFGSHGMPGAARPDMKGNYSPYVKTDADRKAEVMPVTRREDCEAFVEERGGVLHFCVACGDLSKGPLAVAESVPWDSFQNFEEGSHKQWFRARGVADDMLDWGVIIAQSNLGRVVRVAESVHDHAWLVELLVKLQNTFIADREKTQKAFKARIRDIGGGSPSEDDTPIKPF